MECFQRDPLGEIVAVPKQCRRKRGQLATRPFAKERMEMTVRREGILEEIQKTFGNIFEKVCKNMMEYAIANLLIAVIEDGEGLRRMEKSCTPTVLTRCKNEPMIDQ